MDLINQKSPADRRGAKLFQIPKVQKMQGIRKTNKKPPAWLKVDGSCQISKSPQIEIFTEPIFLEMSRKAKFSVSSSFSEKRAGLLFTLLPFIR
jgi:hypothetical protein